MQTRTNPVLIAMGTALAAEGHAMRSSWAKQRGFLFTQNPVNFTQTGKKDTKTMGIAPERPFESWVLGDPIP